MDHRCFLRACLRLTAAESAEASGFIVKVAVFTFVSVEKYGAL